MGSTSSDKQVFDVSKPGKTAAAATARPVIVNHGPMLQDPMMNSGQADKPAKSPESASAPAPSESRKVINPLAADTPQEPTVSDESGPISQGSVAGTSDKADDTAQATNNTNTADSEQAAIVDAVADQTSAKKKNEPSKEEVARLAAMEKLVESKQYFVPLKTTSHKRHAHWLVVFILLLVIVAGAYLAIDAELVDIGLDLPIDLIKD